MMIAHFLKDKKHQNAYNKALKWGKDTKGDLKGMVANSNWRIYINQIAASHGLNLDGDFVDCGVHFGCNAISNIIYTNFEC